MDTPTSDPSTAPIKAAAYVRMSTEHQQYSTDNQMDVIDEYAARHGMQIVKTYSDQGKSGLNIQGRDQLSTMISDVTGGSAEFTHILVYDVSRWGRFQDADESAHYEYICRRAGIAVHYCAEQFENDGSIGSSIIKTVKRSMAGEYSRELSAKVFHGACRLIRLGYKQGGTAGFGLRRMLIDQTGNRKGTLKLGEHKSIQTDRVVLVPGPVEEVETVRWMYQAFVNEGKTELEIAEELNRKHIKTDFGREWTRSTVHEVLSNEKYIGNNVYHRTSCKLKGRHVNNPEDKWVRLEGAFEGVVDQELYLKARERILARSQKLSDADLLELLRRLVEQYGRLSGILIDESEGLPSSSVYRHRFGSLVRAYRLIGYDPGIDFAFLEANRRLREQHPRILENTVSALLEVGAYVTQTSVSGIFVVNGELRVSIILCRHLITEAGASRWILRLDQALRPDITIAVRMNEDNDSVMDYYLLPSIDLTWERMRVAEVNGVYLDAYRFDTLTRFFELAKRTPVEVPV